jgi:hypothetical protein
MCSVDTAYTIVSRLVTLTSISDDEHVYMTWSISTEHFRTVIGPAVRKLFQVSYQVLHRARALNYHLRLAVYTPGRHREQQPAKPSKLQKQVESISFTDAFELISMSE